jgi:hypothetical protein
MHGTVFTEPLFHKVVSGQITQFREIINPQPDFISENLHFAKKNNGDIILPAYGAGEKLYLKEPYIAFESKGIMKVLRKYNEVKNIQDMLKWEYTFSMPAEYARFFIKITGVRAERLRNISDEDCMKAGIEAYDYYEEYMDSSICSYGNGVEDGFEYPCEAYAALIDSISGKGTWESNPFVWVYDFKLTK